MSLSENIKRIRLLRNLTQEQLAKRLNISAQAISKWETSETYPDGALLVPLANALDTSLDVLFDNKKVYIDNISNGIMQLIFEAKKEERFDIIRDLCWQMEKGLSSIFCSNYRYIPGEISEQRFSSHVLNDYGFTHVSNGKNPFFAVFPEPEDGYGDILNDKDYIQNVFKLLSSKETLEAIFYLYSKSENFVFEPMFLANKCEISEGEIENVINELVELEIINSAEVSINGETKTICRSKPKHLIMALFLIAKELNYSGGNTKTIHYRTKPFFVDKPNIK